MSFDWPTADQMFYRLYRLRRLVAVAIAMPVIVMLGLALADPAVLSSQCATLAALAVAALVVGHVVVFPNVTTETMSLSLSVTLLVVCMPFIKAFVLSVPEAHMQAALIILIAFSVVATGVVMALLQIGLSAVAHAGPAVRLRLQTTLDVPCSRDVAFRQCALQPNVRRGRVLTGPDDENGFFDVAVASTHFADPDDPDQPLIVRVDAKVMATSPERHDVMIVLRNGVVTVTSHAFIPTESGCRITVSDMPGDFTLGMYGLFWLTDQQADNLTEMTDVIIGATPRANGIAHGVSLLSLAGALFSPRPPAISRTE